MLIEAHEDLVESVEAVGEVAHPQSLEAVAPEKAMRALVLLSEGKGINAVAGALGLGNCTVARLREDHKEAIEVARRAALYKAAELQAKLGRVMGDKIDMMDPGGAEFPEDRAARERELRATPCRDLTIMYGIVTDKVERLADRPAVRVEVEHKLPSLGEVSGMLDSLRSAKGRVVDVEGT